MELGQGSEPLDAQEFPNVQPPLSSSPRFKLCETWTPTRQQFSRWCVAVGSPNALSNRSTLPLLTRSSLGQGVFSPLGPMSRQIRVSTQSPDRPEPESRTANIGSYFKARKIVNTSKLGTAEAKKTYMEGSFSFYIELMRLMIDVSETGWQS